MKLKNRKTLTMLFILLIFDAAAIAFSTIFAWWLRFPFNVFSIPYKEFIPVSAYLEALPFIEISWIILLAVAGSYRNFLKKPLGKETWDIFKAAAIGTLLNASMTFVWRKYSYSRMATLYAFALAIITLLLTRTLARLIWKAWQKSGIGFTGVILMGSPEDTTLLRQKLSANSEYLVMGTINGIPEEGLLEKASARGAEEIIAVLPVEKLRSINPVIEECVMAGLRLRVVSDFIGAGAGKVSIGKFEDMPSLEFSYGLLDRWNRFLKRLSDVILSVIFASLGAPLILLIFTVVKSGSRGTAFFRQKRLGKGCRETMLLKFRSMRENAELLRAGLENASETDGPIFKMSNDPRVTSVGKILRKYYLDEIPQIWNVLKGEMSFVGPRPLPVDEALKINDNCRRRIIVMPGITGLWQVNSAAKFSSEEMMKLDAYYVNNWSLLMDLKILLRSVYTVFSGKGL